MRHRWFTSLLIAVAAAAGYALAGRAVQAQDTVFPFKTGDTVTFTLVNLGSWPCQVDEVRGMFVRCQPPVPAVGRPATKREEWINVGEVVVVDLARR